MYSIAYVVPFFGKFPKGFQFWLMSCGCNPSIDWLIFTDDHAEYDYPPNVKVTYWSFDKMRERVQQIYDFPISLDRPYKLCDFKPAYGEIFAAELQGYDFWGDCDIDLVWGDIRKFYTDEILSKYEKIGFNGHSMLFKNTPEVCLAIEPILMGLSTTTKPSEMIRATRSMNLEWMRSMRDSRFLYTRESTSQTFSSMTTAFISIGKKRPIERRMSRRYSLGKTAE